MKIRTPTYRRVAWFPLAALLALSSVAAHAVSLIWDSNTSFAGAQDGNGTWNTSTANWYNGSSSVLWPNTGADEAIFGNNLGNAFYNVNFAGTLNLNKMTFNAAGGGANYQINGGTLNFGGATATFAGNGSAGYVAAVIAGTGGLTKIGGGDVLLMSANTYTGTTTISAGRLYLGASFGAGSIVPGSTIANSGGLVFFRNNAITQGTDFGVITGTGYVAIPANAPSTVAVLSSANTYAGGTFVDAGIVRLGSGTGIPPAGNVTVASGAFFDTVSSFSNDTDAGAIGTVTLNGGTMTNSAASNSDYSFNQLVMTGGTVDQTTSTNFWYHLRNAGAAITVNASSTTSRLLGVTTGTHRIQNDSPAAVPITVAAGTTASGIDLDVSTQLSNEGTNPNFTKTGPGTMLLSNIGNTANLLVSAGRLKVDSIVSGSNGPFGSGTITIDGGTVAYGGSVNTTTSKAFTLGTAAGTAIEVNSFVLTVTGVLSGVNGVLNKTGTGILSIARANEYTGPTTVSAGTLRAGIATNAFGVGSAVNVAGDGGLDLAGFSNTIASLTGTSASFVNNSSGTAATLTVGDATASTTYPGTILSTGGGALGLNKVGTGTLILSGPNTHPGTTTVSAGTVKLGSSSAFGAADTAVTKVVVAAGATVDLNGIDNDNYGYTIAGTGVGGSGALINTGASTNLGALQSPNLKLAGDATIGGTGNFALIAGGYAPNSLDLAGFTLTKAGSNTFYLANTTLTAGAVSVNGGIFSQFQSPGNGSAAAFTLANTAGVTLNLNGLPLSIGALTGGGAAGGNVILGFGTLTVGNLGTTTSYAGAISGAGGLINKTGAGTLTLTGANNYTGGTTVSGGTLLGIPAGPLTLTTGAGASTALFNSSQTLTSLASGALGAGTAAVNLNGAGVVLTINQTANTTYGGGITGTGSVTKLNSGALTLSGASNYTGPTTITGGKLTLSNVGNGFISGIAVGAGTTLELNSTAGVNAFDSMVLNGNAITGSATITKTGAGIVQYSNTTVLADFAGTVDIQAGTFGSAISTGTIGKAGSLMTVNVGAAGLFDMRVSGPNGARIDKLTGTGRVGNTWNGPAPILTVGTGNGSSQFNGQILGNGTSGTGDTGNPNGSPVALVKTGAGTFTLGNRNTYGGGTTVTAGTLALSGGGDGGSATIVGTVTINSGATLTARTTNWDLGFSGVATSGTTAIVINGGTLAFSGSNAAGGMNADLTMTNGTIIGSQFDIYSAAGGHTLTVNAGTSTISSGMNLRNPTGLVINTAPGAALTVSGAIASIDASQGNITKTGTGTLTLTAASTYSGTTAINGGTVIAGETIAAGVSATGTGPVNVNNTGTLTGGNAAGTVGSVRGALTVNSGGKVAPGVVGPGTFTVNGSTAFTAGSILEIQINGIAPGTGYDRVKANGTVAVGGASLVLSGSLVATPGQVFTIVENDGSDAVSGSFAGLPEGTAVTLGGVGLIISYIGGDGNDVVLRAPFKVLNADAAGVGSLRDTIATAPTGSTIVFDLLLSGKTITLNGAELLIDKDLSISGTGLANGITISGNNLSRVFNIASGRVVTMAGLTITGGNADGSDGGGVRSAGSLILDRCTFFGNTAYEGGAVRSIGSPLTATNCTFTANTASIGGGLSIADGGPAAALTHCTVSGNTATGNAPNYGGGIFFHGKAATLTNCLIAGNYGTDAPDLQPEAGSVLTSAGANLIGDNSAAEAFFPEGSLAGTFEDPLDARLAPLSNYGGPTPTMPLLVGSPAIDAGGATSLTTDQRGFPRVVSGSADIGAVELGPILTVTNASNTGAGSLRTAITSATTVGSVIRFSSAFFNGEPADTIGLASELTVGAAQNLFIDASDISGGVTVSGQNSVRLFSNPADSNLALHSLTVTGGNTNQGGGGIGNTGTLTLIQTTISHCTTTSRGGGLDNTGVASLIQCAIHDNHATDLGGGINSNNLLTVVNSTVSGNTSAASGGGINLFNTATVTNSTISGNTGTNGGGLNIEFGNVRLGNTIIAGNTGTVSGPDLSSALSSGTLTSTGANLIGNNQGVENDFAAGTQDSDGGYVANASGDYVGIPGDPLDPGLGELAHNGGPTWTMMLLAGSPAVDAGVPSVGTPFTDQRGFERILAAGLDIGAYETGAGNFNLAGLTLYARMPEALTEDGVRIEISTDRDFLPVVSTLAGGGYAQPGLLAEIYLNGNQGTKAGNLGYIAAHPANGATIIPNINWSHPGGLPGNGYPDNLAAADNGGANSTNLFAKAVPGQFTGDQSNYGVQLTGQIHIPGDAARGGVESIRFHDGVDDYAYLEIDGVVLIDDNNATTERSTTNGGGAQATLDVSDAKYNDGAWVSFRMVTWEGGFDDSNALAWDALDRTGADNVTGGTDATLDTYNPANLADGPQVNFAINETDWIPAANLRSIQPGPGWADGPRATARFNYVSGVARDSDGFVFIADTANHRIRMLSPDGEVTTIAGTGIYGFADGPGPGAMFSFPAAVAVGPYGNLYVSDTFNHRIRKLTRPAISGLPWTVTTLAGTGIAGSTNGAGTAAKFSHPHGLVLDAAGNVFVADTVNNRIRQVTPAGVVSTYAGSATAGATEGAKLTAAKFNYPFGVALDGTDSSTANLYVADRDNHRIRKVTPGAGGVVSTLAGSTVGFTDATGASARFSKPVAVAFDALNNLLYVSDENNQRIRSITMAGLVTNVAGLGTTGAGADRGSIGSENGNNTVARFHDPSGLLVDPDGNLLIADAGNHRLRRIVIKPITVADVNTTIGELGPGGVAVSAIIDPVALGLDEGTLYYFRWRSLYDNSTQMLGQSFILTAPPTVVTEAADPVSPTGARLNATVNPKGSTTAVLFEYSTDPNLAGPWQVGSLAAGGGMAPRGVAENVAAGVSYVADRDGHAIIVFDEQGQEVERFGSGTAGFADGSYTTAQFDRPAGLAFDGVNQRLYVADELNQRIRWVDLNDGTVYTLAGSSVAGFADGAGNAARFLFPTGVAVATDGSVYVADSGNHRIRKVALDGTVTTVAGTALSGFADGPAASAQFYTPRALAVSTGGDIYVADTGNHMIRVLSAGTVSTLAGSGTEGFLDGLGTVAQLASPAGIAFDENGGVLYVADGGNHRIRGVALSGLVNTIAGSGVAALLDSPASELHPATATQFNLPSGIAVAADSEGHFLHLLVTEEGNGALRRIERGELPTVTATPRSTGTGDRIVGADTQPLLPGGTYYFRANATNGRGPARGAILNFTTPQPQIAVYNGDSTAAPQLSSGQTVDFGVTPRGTPVARQFTVASIGGSVLYFSGISVPAGYQISDGSAFELLPTETRTFTVTLEATDGGSFDGNIEITTDDPEQGNFNLPVTGLVLAPPEISPVLVSDATATGFTLSATVNPLGTSTGSRTTVWFEYSPDAEFDGMRVTTVAGAEPGFANGTGTAALFDQPLGLATDAAGNLYVADTLNHRIRKMTPAGVVTTVAGTGAPGFANGAAAAAQFDGPAGVVVGAGGILFVADSNNHRIRAISPAGQVTTYCGLGVPGYTDGVASGARFNFPKGLAIDTAGNLYVADSGNGYIRKVATDGSVSSLADSSGPAAGIAATGSGVVYFSGGHRINRISAAGVMDIDFAGQYFEPGFADGLGADARFIYPAGLATDASGNLYVADQGNQRIRKVTPAGVVTTLAGSGIPGHLDGLGEVAQFDSPVSVAVNAAGEVFVGELTHSTIRRIAPTTVVVEAATGLSGTAGILVSKTITGLVPGTTYYIRAFATNGGGTTYTTLAPEIAVEQPDLADGGTRDFGFVAVGSGNTLTFTIRNVGSSPLHVTDFQKSGANAGDFVFAYGSFAAPLADARGGHTATLLANGKVLVVGGINDFGGSLASAELYDPVTGLWSATTNSLAVARFSHTATLLANGKVLVTGGYNDLAGTVGSAELYDLVTGLWSTTTNSPAAARIGHTATLLANGKVLVAGGNNEFDGDLTSAELYDPVTGLWSATTNSLADARVSHTATLLANGKVLIAGGGNDFGGSLASAELYDPVTGLWSATTNSPAVARNGHTATLLTNGKVLVAGGRDDFAGSLASAELYDPVAGTWSPAPQNLATARRAHTATLLADGKVLVAGGTSNSEVLASAELYDPIAGTWSPTSNNLTSVYSSHTATRLADGRVLVAGGYDEFQAVSLASTELYDPATGTWSGSLAPGASMTFTVTFAPSGSGSRSAELQIFSDDADESPFHITLTGRVMEPEIVLERAPGLLVGTGSLVTAWGNDDYGQKTVPAGLNGVMAIAAGYFHTVALKIDGTVEGWGNDAYGQATAPPGLSGVRAIAAGELHTVALKTDGTVEVWGDDGYGQKMVPVGLNGVSAIAAGDVHTVVLKTDGTVRAWGSNDYGQTTVPEGLSGVMAIAAGANHSVALKTDGTVQAWGYNGSGQTDVPAGLSGVIAIAAGWEHTVALKANGTVEAWGSDDFGQRTVPVGLGEVVAIAANYYQTVALKNDGTVVAWGNNDSGQTDVPAGLSGVTAISSGWWHTVALVGAPGLVFGSQNVGATSAAQTVTIRNTGSAPLSVTGVSIVGANSGDFAVSTAGMLSSVPIGGQTTVSVTFHPTVAGARAAILRVLSNDADEAVSDVALTGTGTGGGGTPFQIWQGVWFGANAGNPLLAGALANPSKDGVVNLHKYAFGLNPLVPSGAGLPVVGVSGGALTLTYTRVLSATDIYYTPEWSADLASWSTVGITEQIVSDNGTTRQMRASVPVAGAPKMYLRLRASFQPPP